MAVQSAGNVIPELDGLLAETCTNFPTPQNPVLPLDLRLPS